MLKRGFDIFFGSVAIALLLPVMLAIAAAVVVSMGQPVLFRQLRSGFGGKDFELFKFRSMREINGNEGQPLPDAQRVTALGRFLRRFRLDELPELFLVVGGAMSLVGPRPLPRETLALHATLAERSRVRPGLTGLAQISGNTLLNGEEKLAIDCYYVSHNSLFGDIAILLGTLRTVIIGEQRNEAIIRKALEHANGIDRRGR